MTCQAQAPTPAQLYTYYKAVGDSVWLWRPLIIDPPLTITRDSSGQAHLGIQQPCKPDSELYVDMPAGKRVVCSQQ